jgi:hypothetical protein
VSGLDHFDKELYALDKRIRRLAIACGVDVTQDGIIVSLIKGNYGVCPSGNNPKREELRGLLMLKYNIEEHCIDSIGVDECLQIIEEVENKLRKQGFSGGSKI